MQPNCHDILSVPETAIALQRKCDLRLFPLIPALTVNCSGPSTMSEPLESTLQTYFFFIHPSNVPCIGPQGPS